MKQYICDRCGNIIYKYSTRNHIVLYDSDVKYGAMLHGNDKYNEYDLCDNCLRVLNKINDSFISYDKTNEEILDNVKT